MSNKACIVVIGQEILAGATQDTNSGYIAKKLREIGVETTQIITIPDEVDTICNTLKDAVTAADIIITTGGLGPTKDDKTKKAFADFFSREMQENSEVLAHLKAYLESKNKADLFKNNVEQASIPQGAVALLNSMGTAPGLHFDEGNKLFFVLPGVPYEMKHLLNNQVLPIILQKLKLPYLVTQTLFVTGIPESKLSIILEDWELGLDPGFSLSYLPENSLIRLRLSCSGENLEETKTNVKEKLEEVKNKIPGHYFETLGESKEAIIQFHLIRLGYTLSTVESFTGGALMKKLISEPGSSEVIAGGLCTYQTSQKISILGIAQKDILKSGVVSEEIALQMMQSAKTIFKSNVCISTTGSAGPSPDAFDTPVGTSFYAIGIGNETKVKKLYFPNLEREDYVTFCVNRILQDLIISLENLS